MTTVVKLAKDYVATHSTRVMTYRDAFVARWKGPNGCAHEAITAVVGDTPSQRILRLADELLSKNAPYVKPWEPGDPVQWE